MKVPVCRIALGLMVVITVLSISLPSYKYGYLDGESHAREYSLVKTPIEYGITKSYVAERLGTEPGTWYTPDELGVVLIKSSHFGHYYMYIAREHEDKALAWMRDEEFDPEAVKYMGQFYEIWFLWVTPGLSESVGLLLVRVVMVLGLGWFLTAIVCLRSKVRTNPVG